MKNFFVAKKERKKGRERERERGEKIARISLAVFHTSRTKRIGNECVCPIFFVRLSIHLDNNFVGPERVLSSTFPGISKSFRGGLSSSRPLRKRLARLLPFLPEELGGFKGYKNEAGQVFVHRNGDWISKEIVRGIDYLFFFFCWS